MQLHIGLKISYQDLDQNKTLQGIVAAFNLPAPWEGHVRVISNGMIHYTPTQSILKIHGWN